MNYVDKYLKYKNKYLLLKKSIMTGGSNKKNNTDNELVNFKKIKKEIKNINFTNKFIFLFYQNYVISIYFTIDCCETSWFELFDEKKLIDIDDKYKVNYKNHKIFTYKKNKNELDSLEDLTGKTIKSIGFKGYVFMKKSNIQEEDLNKVYKISTTDNKYIYFVLRISSNGFYESDINTIKLSYAQYNNLISDKIESNK